MESKQRSVTCDKENVGYKGECTRCQAGAVAYIGETSKTAYTRLSQHLAAYKTASAAQLPAQPQHVDPLSRPRAAKSWMWEHTRDKHQGIVGPNEGRDDYKVKVEGRFLKCFYQQADEDVRMQLYEASGGELLNSKYEYYMPKSVQPVFRQQ